MSAERYSQFSDEKLIDAALEVSGVRWKQCCEIGAGDGLTLPAGSNTAHFVRHRGWKGVFIESDEKLADLCRENYAGFDVEVVCALITAENINSFVPERCDLLSIDVDGNDYWLFLSLKTRPSVVIIEYNSQKSGVDAVHPYVADYKRNSWDYSYGCSRDALCRIANAKGYKLIGDDGYANCVFALGW